MKLKDDFQLVELGDEYLIVPVGEKAVSFQGVVAINRESAILIKKLKDDVTLNELIEILVREFNIDHDVAEHDVIEFVRKISEIGLLE